MRSSLVKDGVTRATQRSLLKATGLSNEDLKKPLIGVVNSFNEVNPGHVHLREIAEEVKLGIAAAGGVGLEFPVIALCDGIAILLDGRITFAGTAGELADRLGTCYSVRIKTNLGLEEFEVEDIEKELPAILRACREKNAAIKDIQVDRGSLERHFVRITKGE